jgi:hypothetical protein
MQLKYHDVVLNHFVGDLWLVDYFNNELRICLVPNSGYIGHPDNKYPAHVEDLETAEFGVEENWELLGNLDENPELLEGLNCCQYEEIGWIGTPSLNFTDESWDRVKIETDKLDNTKE